MNTPKTISLAGLCGAFGFLAGCASDPDSHLVTAPPPPPPTATAGYVAPAQPVPVQVAVPQQTQSVYTPATATTPATVTSYVVTQAPPAPQPEAVPPRPSSSHVWIAGYWTWQNSRYAWMAGHWEVPPYTGATWVNPRWEPEGTAFRFYEGRWN
jgi:hypothetical protein